MYEYVLFQNWNRTCKCVLTYSDMHMRLSITYYAGLVAYDTADFIGNTYSNLEKPQGWLPTLKILNIC
jgi:hypothetical protein